MQVFLETDRLVLRRFSLADADNLVNLDADPDVMRYVTGGIPTSREEIQNEFLPAFLSYYQRYEGYGFWAAIEKATGEFLGWFHFRPGPDAAPGEVELGYRLRKSAWGKGYKDGKHIIFGVSLNSDNGLIGLVGLKDINYINQSAEFYVIIGDRSVWGKGYGTEATKLMFRYGFMELNLNRIQTKDFEENIGGWRADEKAGMKFEGRLRQSMFRFGKYHDERVYSILRSEFLESL